LVVVPSHDLLPSFVNFSLDGLLGLHHGFLPPGLGVGKMSLLSSAPAWTAARELKAFTDEIDTLFVNATSNAPNDCIHG
jgi:hypothetical protein